MDLDSFFDVCCLTGLRLRAQNSPLLETFPLRLDIYRDFLWSDMLLGYETIDQHEHDFHQYHIEYRISHGQKSS